MTTYTQQAIRREAQSRMVEVSNDTTLTIHTLLPLRSVNWVWVREALQEFMRTSHKNIREYAFDLTFSMQPVKNKILRCVGCLWSRRASAFATGEGRDEYEAIEDFITDLDVALLEEGQQTPPFPDEYADEDTQTHQKNQKNTHNRKKGTEFHKGEIENMLQTQRKEVHV